MFQVTLQDQLQKALSDLGLAQDLQSLYDVKVRFTGKQGYLSEVMKEMAKVPKEEKPAFGKLVNEVKTTFETSYLQRELEIQNAELNAKVKRESIDVTLPGSLEIRGSRHPIHMIINESVEILSRLGYAVRTGPQIEKDWFNFEALNIPPDHPSRDMQDTF